MCSHRCMYKHARTHSQNSEHRIQNTEHWTTNNEHWTLNTTTFNRCPWTVAVVMFMNCQWGAKLCKIQNKPKHTDTHHHHHHYYDSPFQPTRLHSIPLIRRPFKYPTKNINASGDRRFDTPCYLIKSKPHLHTDVYMGN